MTTLSQEAVNPERDLPRATILCLFITTLLYCAVSGVLTGMVRFPMEPEVWEGGCASTLAGSGGVAAEGSEQCLRWESDAPVSSAFAAVGLPWAEAIVSIGAICGLTTTILVTILGRETPVHPLSRGQLRSSDQS